MATPTSLDGTSIVADFRGLSLNLSEEQPCEPKIEKVGGQKDSAHGNVVVYENLWEQIESWMRSETMQLGGKRNEKEHACRDRIGHVHCTMDGSNLRAEQQNIRFEIYFSS